MRRDREGKRKDMKRQVHEKREGCREKRGGESEQKSEKEER